MASNATQGDEDVHSEASNASNSTLSSEKVSVYVIDEEGILAERIHDGIKQYLIKWQGYGEERNTWEPVESLGDPETLVDWEKKQERINAGLESPFDLTAYESRVSTILKDTAERRAARRVEKTRESAQIDMVIDSNTTPINTSTAMNAPLTTSNAPKSTERLAPLRPQSRGPATLLAPPSALLPTSRFMTNMKKRSEQATADRKRAEQHQFKQPMQSGTRVEASDSAPRPPQPKFQSPWDPPSAQKPAKRAPKKPKDPKPDNSSTESLRFYRTFAAQNAATKKRAQEPAPADPGSLGLINPATIRHQSRGAWAAEAPTREHIAQTLMASRTFPDGYETEERESVASGPYDDDESAADAAAIARVERLYAEAGADPALVRASMRAHLGQTRASEGGGEGVEAEIGGGEGRGRRRKKILSPGLCVWCGSSGRGSRGG